MGCRESSRKGAAGEHYVMRAGASNSISPPSPERHPLYSTSRCGYNGKKGIHNRGVHLIPCALLPLPPDKSYCEIVYVQDSTIQPRNITETIHQISKKKYEKKIIQNTRNIPHFYVKKRGKYCGDR